MRGGHVRGMSSFALVAIAVVVGTQAASAGGVPEADMNSRLEKVSHGGNAAYTSTFTHSGKSQTHVRFHNPIPENADGAEAVFQHASCTGTLGPTEFVCNPIKLKKGETATVTIVWKTFPDGSSDCEGSEPCFVNTAFWTSDSGTNAPQKPKKTANVAAETEFTDGDTEAATYALDACDPDVLATATMATNPALTEDNPLATTVCIPDFDAPGQLDPGLLGTVLEQDVDELPEVPEGAAGQGSDICVAASNCGDPFEFDDRIVFTFRIDEETFFPSEITLLSFVSPVTQVFHDGDPVPLCEDDPDADPCVESIGSDGVTTTVVATARENGLWIFGG
jgi:hypothetical protein